MHLRPHTDTLLAAVSGGAGALAAFRWDELLHGGIQSFITAGAGALAIVLVNLAARRWEDRRRERANTKPNTKP